MGHRTRGTEYTKFLGTATSQCGGNSSARCLFSFCWDKEMEREIRFSI